MTADPNTDAIGCTRHQAECWACANGKHCAWREWGCGQDDHDPSDTCACAASGWCGEGSEAGCCLCVHTDIYEPCPVFGFGCGLTAAPGEAPCEDCCEPEQYAAALASPVYRSGGLR